MCLYAVQYPSNASIWVLLTELSKTCDLLEAPGYSPLEGGGRIFRQINGNLKKRPSLMRGPFFEQASHVYS